MEHRLSPDIPKYQAWRRRMVTQLRAEGIHDESLLAAMEKIPRHWFWNDTLLDNLIYDINTAIQIDCGQTLSKPITVARQTQLLNLQPMLSVLEVGTGSGYQTAVLCEMGARVFTVERQNDLFVRTKSLLATLHYTARCYLGDCSRGLPEMRGYMFDRVLVTCGATEVPPVLMSLLKVGGIMVIPVENASASATGASQKMLRIFKDGESPDGWRTEECGDAYFVPMLKGRQF
ncbi:MAG: protein-L-isoaspartate O-methyltransferase [Bacteroidales bacterium]|nr:protein-L-isoaspartate O-methyltransferase [Bacteroidales bacterium]